MFRNRRLFTWGHLITPLNLAMISIGDAWSQKACLFILLYLLWATGLVLFNRTPKQMPLSRHKSAAIPLYMAVDLSLLAALILFVPELGQIIVWNYVTVVALYAVEFGRRVSFLFSFCALAMTLPFHWAYYGGWSDEFFKQTVPLIMIQMFFAIFVGAVTDKLHRLAYFDPLTLVPNRTYTKEILNAAIRNVKAAGGQIAVYFLDLDRFKNLNDTMGHDAGDELLIQVAKRLTGLLPEKAVLGRLGGDEFIVFWPEAKDMTAMEALGERLVCAFHPPFHLGGKSLQISTSIGISVFPFHGEDVSTLMKHADAAMYSAKRRRNRVEFFQNEALKALQEKYGLETDLAQAQKNGELLLHYQPKVDIRTGNVNGMEALLRWKHPVKGMISPADFIPIAEEQGYIVAIGEWVLEAACRQAAAWGRSGTYTGSVSVNLSVHQFYDPGFLEKLARILKETGLEPSRLDLEITESVAMQNSDYSVQLLHSMNKLGVSTSLDDFGTGYSSLSYLTRYPLQALKIDKSFIQEMTDSESHGKIVKSIIQMAQSLRMRTVAEGVETWEQYERLKRLGCNEVQGFLFSRPVPADEVPQLLAQRRTKQKKQAGGAS